eukprot:TRINITY_DN59048_c0_g1_i1.p1 TRINITY_DN59048_c0_g1~~TRINITY_DN59048_c0_g1_i1.p1  ORF type:complete len:486 (+),score=102.07 TRINITY_DN59048_c0_g1_i1:52-1509(+)
MMHPSRRRTSTNLRNAQIFDKSKEKRRRNKPARNLEELISDFRQSSPSNRHGYAKDLKKYLADLPPTQELLLFEVSTSLILYDVNTGIEALLTSARIRHSFVKKVFSFFDSLESLLKFHVVTDIFQLHHRKNGSFNGLLMATKRSTRDLSRAGAKNESFGPTAAEVSGGTVTKMAAMYALLGAECTSDEMLSPPKIPGRLEFNALDAKFIVMNQLIRTKTTNSALQQLFLETHLSATTDVLEQLRQEQNTLNSYQKSPLQIILKERRIQLQNFLKIANKLNLKKTLEVIPETLKEEQCIILRRMGEHPRVLFILLREMCNLTAALAYCDSVFVDEGIDMLTTMLTALRQQETYLRTLPQSNRVMKQLAEIPKGMSEVLDRMQRRGSSDTTRALDLLSSQFSLQSVLPFLKYAFATSNRKKRDAEMSTQLAKQSLQTEQRNYSHEQQKFIVIDGSQRCNICGDVLDCRTAFKRLPNGSAVHFGCVL